MEIIRPDINYDFMGKWWLFGGISAFAVVTSIILFLYPGLNYGIDFRGGTQIQLSFGRGIDASRIRGALEKTGFQDSEVVQFGGGRDEYLITVLQTTPIEERLASRAKRAVASAFARQGMVEESFRISSSGDQLQIRFGEEIDAAELERVLRGTGLKVREHREGEHAGTVAEEGAQAVACDAPVCRLLPLNEFKYEIDLVGVSSQVLAGLRRQLGERNVNDPVRIIYVGPKVGEQLGKSAIMSLVYACFFIMLYVAFRFDLRFAPGGVIALMHDAMVTVGFFVALQQQFSLPIVAALLTIIGYSINDTVVIFDRIRENLQKHRERDLSMVVNRSINETLSRTLLTNLVVLFTLFAIFFLGGGLIRDFALAMIIGVIAGTYSTIFIASPIVVLFDRWINKRSAA
jgi:preprotein translocase subunit SecF